MKMHTGGNYGREDNHEEQSKEKNTNKQPNCGGDLSAELNQGMRPQRTKALMRKPEK